MRAIVMHEPGGPEVLRPEEVPEPSPGPGQVVIRVEAAGVGYADTLLRARGFPLPVPLPAVFGFEAAGTVTETGDGVDPALVGTRVVTLRLGGDGGTYAEYARAEADSLTVVPEPVTPSDAVAVAVQGAVALTLVREARLTGNETVLVEVAAGGVGAYLTQLAPAMGAGRVVATAGSAGKRRQAEDLGADLVLDHTDPGWTDRVAEEGGTLDVVFESIGGASAGRLLDAMTPGTGRMLLYGVLDGPPAVAPIDLLRRGLTLAGCGGLTGWALRVQEARAEVLEMLAAGRLRPWVDSVLPLEEAAAAHRRIEERAASGKIVLVP
ncbi:quinone oxidoreductase family protein [Microbispora sp. ATCC PTA-5024]|uniref:quinone oxidoreductase family protein n=1 Tax=Microbispora sp. ATCC PTA-5024 TaxID=316330 RepID=UPI0003DDF0FB|nr:zinc-binding dehydrogenase [Microbispora sp. ATCC PTA-5024]ETK35781.1 hypothetical protein MPTA5024_12435 [Microbispora sp. ATCC PTA-5024]